MNELQHLENELAHLEEENARLEEEVKTSPLHTAAWGARTVAKGLSGIADLPVVGYNLAKMPFGGDWTKLPSEHVGEAIDTLTGGYTKPRSGWQKTAEPYLEAVSTLPGAGYAGKALTTAARGAKGATKVGKFLEQGTKLNPTNVGVALGSTFGARQAENIAPDSTLGAIAGPIVGGIVGGGIPSSASAIGKAFNPKKMNDLYTQAVMRTKNVGEPFIQELPDYFGGKEIISQTHEKGGKLAYEGAQKNKERFSNFFNTQKSRINHLIEKKGVNPDEIRVDVAPLVEWVGDIYKGLETPGMRKDLLDSPLGKNISKLFHFKGEESSLADALLNPREHLNTKVKYKELLRFREKVDDSLVDNFNQIGPLTKGELKTLRGKVSQETENAIHNVSPEAYKLLKKFNKNYGEYADKYIESFNSILENRYKPEKSFKASTRDLSEGAYDFKSVVGGLKGKEKTDFTKSLLRDFGKVEDRFDIQEFHKNFSKLEPNVQNLIKRNLDSETRNNLNQQLKILKGYEKITNNEGILDILYKRPSLSVTKQLYKLTGRAIAKEKWASPEGRQKLIETALKAQSDALGKSLDVKVNSKASHLKKVLLGNIGIHRGEENEPIKDENELHALLNEAQELGIDVSDIMGDNSHYAKGGHVRNKYADGGPTIEELYPGMEDAIAEYGKFIGKNKGTGEGFSPEYIKEVKDQVLKEANEDGYLRNQLKNKDWGFLNNLNLVESNKKSGGAQKKNAFGQTREEALKPINQAFITSEDKDIANNKGVKYLRELYKKAQDPNASWNDINDAVFASEMLSQGYNYTGNMWEKDDTDILSAIRDIPIVGDIAKATGVDRMVSNMDNLIKSKDIGEGFKNALTFAADTGSTLASAISNPGKFATDAVTNLAMDKLTPSSEATEQYEGQQYGYPQQYQQYGYQSYSPYSQPYGGGYNPYGYNQSSPYGYQQSMSHMAPNSKITQAGYHSYGSNQQSTMNQSGNQYTANPNFNTSSYQHQYDKPQ